MDTFISGTVGDWLETVAEINSSAFNYVIMFM